MLWMQEEKISYRCTCRKCAKAEINSQVTYCIDLLYMVIGLVPAVSLGNLIYCALMLCCSLAMTVVIL